MTNIDIDYLKSLNFRDFGQLYSRVATPPRIS